MALKWQTILKITGGSSVSVFVIIFLILNLSGMTYSIPGDIKCGTDCFSEIQVNSTYWEICVEHSGDRDLIYKKVTRGRRLWLNLDKIDSVIETSPNIFTEILVPTVKRYADFDTEFGYLRKVKDGDCIIKRRTKANDRPSRIIIHGVKSAEQTVKWGFTMNDILMDGIVFDPLWIGSPLSDGLVALYHFDGDYLDSSGNDNHGTPIGTTNTSDGRFGAAMNFDGVGDYVSHSISDSINDTTDTSLTLSVWIKPTTELISGTERFIDYTFVYGILFTQGTIEFVRFGNDGSGYLIKAIQTATTINAEWTNFVGTYDNVEELSSLYRNGVLVATGTKGASAGGNPGTPAIGIGISSTMSLDSPFDGKIDQVMIFNRSLSDDEVLQLFDNGKFRINTGATKLNQNDGLVGLWNMNADSGNATAIFDTSGNGNDGNLGGGVQCRNVTGYIGTGCDFNGVDDYINITTSLFGVSNLTTLSVWIKTPVTTDAYRNIYAMSSVSAEFHLRLTPVGTINAFTRTWGESEMSFDADLIMDNAWHHIVTTIDKTGNTANTLYLDGVLKASFTASSTITETDSYIGSKLGANEFWEGSIDEVMVFNRSLSASEIQDLYNLKRGEFQINTTGKMRFYS